MFKTEEQEKEYLRQIINIINNSVNNTDKSVKEHVDTLQEYKEYLWSNKDIDPHEIRSMRESILRHFATGESVIDKRKRLGKILDIPYFGRIDFTERKEGSETRVLYIGIHTFYDPGKKANLIHDWRAPISSMFYDHELGAASYSSPTGEVEGDISLKRQYRIRKGQMEYMIESSLTVHDDVLQKELSSNTDDKMKNIVTTIQREQNRIIRNEDTQTLIIQGVAGSGKTSIALHRIAYLLYAQKGEITSKDILIISPNKVFADYISNVLPELGEETVPETSMEQILSGVLNNKYKYQNFFEQVTELLEKPTPGFIERIQYKASFDFISQLEKFILHMENHYCHGRSDETLQELPIHVRDHEFCTKDSNERRTGSHHPTRGKANHSLFQEPGRRTFRHLEINYHIQKIDLQIIGDSMQNRNASTRDHGETQIVHGQPLFPIPPEYGFCQRNHRHLIPYGKGFGI